MQKCEFVNFIGFGKHANIDLRAVYGPAAYMGQPVHVIASAQISNEIQAAHNATSFVKMANRVFAELCDKLEDAGQGQLALQLTDSLNAHLDGEHGSISEEMAGWITFIYMLNETECLYEAPQFGDSSSSD